MLSKSITFYTVTSMSEFQVRIAFNAASTIITINMLVTIPFTTLLLIILPSMYGPGPFQPIRNPPIFFPNVFYVCLSVCLTPFLSVCLSFSLLPELNLLCA